MIIGTQDADIAKSQADNALEVDMVLQDYLWKGWPADYVTQIQQELSVLDAYPLEKSWLDVEDLTDWPGVTIAIDQIFAAMGLLAHGRRNAGIYASRASWRAITGNTNQLNIYPLYAAAYSDDDDINNWAGPFGGWTQCQMRQHAQNQRVAGVLCDLNVYRERG